LKSSSKATMPVVQYWASLMTPMLNATLESDAPAGASNIWYAPAQYGATPPFEVAFVTIPVPGALVGGQIQ
jgi:hypothetical protein